MIIRAVDQYNDWLFGQGIGSYAQALAAIQENIKTRLQEWVGDCFFAQQDGIDWANLLGVGTAQSLKAAVDKIIIQSFGVVALVSSSLNLDPIRRAISFTYSVNTIYSHAFTSMVNLTPTLIGLSSAPSGPAGRGFGTGGFGTGTYPGGV
jgi:hypothetical protein